MKQLVKIFGVVMVLVYAAVGVMLLAITGFVSGFTGYPRYILGLLLVLYAVFRGYRVLKPDHYE
ncbi:MAG: hypothetical protein AB2L24_07235 [Mangrovibacterium sp.]|jgi:hypothetical protein